MRDPIRMQWQPYATSGSLPTAADGMPPVCNCGRGEPDPAGACGGMRAIRLPRVALLACAIVVSCTSWSCPAAMGLAAPVDTAAPAAGMRLRGGAPAAPGRKMSAAQQAAAIPAEAMKFSASYTGKLTGGASALQAAAAVAAAPAEASTDADAGADAGPLVASATISELQTYDPHLMHKTDPWVRALVNEESFEAETKGRNLVVGNTAMAPLYGSFPMSVPLVGPLALLSIPMWCIPPLPGGKAKRVRLVPDSGDWVNRWVSSPLTPMNSLFKQRRTDPLEAMQRRPWLKIPLKVTGPMHQPHSSCNKINPSELTGGMVLTDKLMQMHTGDILNYFEVRAGAHSQYSSIGVMTQAAFEESDAREFDASGIPSRGSVCFTGTGALLWNMGEEGVESAEMSEPSDESRALRPGDRIGIVVDISVGVMAVIRNGKQVLLRKGLPVGEAMRFVVGCSKVGSSWTVVRPRKARQSLKSVDWQAFYSSEDAHKVAD